MSSPVRKNVEWHLRKKYQVAAIWKRMLLLTQLLLVFSSESLWDFSSLEGFHWSPIPPICDTLWPLKTTSFWRQVIAYKVFVGSKVCATNLAPHEFWKGNKRYVPRFKKSKCSQQQHLLGNNDFSCLLKRERRSKKKHVFVPSLHLIVGPQEMFALVDPTMHPKLRKETLVALNCNKGSTSTKGCSEKKKKKKRRSQDGEMNLPSKKFWDELPSKRFSSNFSRYQLHNSFKISQQNKAKTPKHHPIKEVFAELNPPVTSPQQKTVVEIKELLSMHFRDEKKIHTPFFTNNQQKSRHKVSA